MLRSLRHRIGALIAAPSRPHIDQLNARVDHLERVLERDRNDAVQAIASVETTINARIDAGRNHAEAAANVALRKAVDAAHAHTDAAVEASRSSVIDAARAHAEAAANDAAREHAEAAMHSTAATTSAHLARVRGDIARLHRSLERIGQRPPPPAADAGSTAPAAGEPSQIDDLLYLAIEDRFRGDPEEIRQRQRRYVDLVADHVTDEFPLLDLGCGRGEWLAVLAENGLAARGIDSNASCVDECAELGLEAELGGLVDVLADSADASFGAVTMFHVVEHLPFDVLASVLRECARVLKPGGMFIAETPNALNLRVAATNFWLDPTHVRPLHPELLRLLAERSGFAKMEDLFLHDIGVPLELPDRDDDLARWLIGLSRSIDGPGDYALLAWTPD